MENHGKYGHCATCGQALSSKAKSGYCRIHFARSLHDDPARAGTKARKHRDTCAASPNREIVRARLARLSRSRLAWCPESYKGLYRQLARKMLAAEARALIQAQIASDISRRLVRPQLRRAA